MFSVALAFGWGFSPLGFLNLAVSKGGTRTKTDHSPKSALNVHYRKHFLIRTENRLDCIESAIRNILSRS